MSGFFDFNQERAVLAYALATKASMTEAMTAIRSDLFEDTRHNRLWEAACRYYHNYGGVIDRSGLQAMLVQNEAPQDKQVMYLAVFDEVKTQIVTQDQFKIALDVLEDLRFKRGLFDMINGAAAHLQRGQVDRQKVCNDIVTSMLSLQAGKDLTVRESNWKNELAVRQAEYRDRKANPDKYRGVPYGFRKIDQLTGGMYGGELSIIFGRPASGKSALCTNIAYNVASRGLNCALFTIEMPKEQVNRRLDSRHAQISARGLRNALLNPMEERKYLEQMSVDIPGEIIVEDMPQGCSVAQMLPVIRRLKMNRKVDLVLVDYLNLMEPSKWSNSKVERVSDVARELKQLARLENTPILTPARASRDVVNVKEDNVGTEHLSWSDSIGYDADFIMYLKKGIAVNALTAQIEAIVVKFRDGGEERIELGVNFDTSFIGDLEDILTNMKEAVGAPSI